MTLDWRTEPPDVLRAALDAVLGSVYFRYSERLRRFLTFCYERTLAGDGVKEALVGVMVFDRRAGYNTQGETIVRVEARRLRLKLEAYYAGPGRHDPVRVGMPLGGYTLEFQRLAGAEDPATQSAAEDLTSSRSVAAG